MSELLSLCSLSQGGQVCRDWIFHGIVPDCFKVLDRSELEGKELCNTTFLQESKDIILLFKKQSGALFSGSSFSGGILQHREASGASVLTSGLLPATPEQQHVVHRHVCLHCQLCSLRLQQCWSPQPVHHWRHGKLLPPESHTFFSGHQTDLTFLTLLCQIPKSSPIRLNTKTFGAFIPQVTTQFGIFKVFKV